MKKGELVNRVGGAALIFAALGLSACGLEEDGPASRALTLYSPAPPTIMLHDHNLELGEALTKCGIENLVVAMALPESVNNAGALKAEDKPYHLPIMTTLDFLPAINRSGPVWHSYDKANDDLKFVSSLYDVAFGVLAFDDDIATSADLIGKRIGAPPRPSAVRLYTEALLRDGWGILDKVEIVDILPPDLPSAIRQGRIDATTWNLLSETAAGFRPMAPALLAEGAQWIVVDEAVADRINEANGFKVELSEVDLKALAHRTERQDTEAVSLLSFRQALAAWDST
ncbi:MAG: ABC transporter substrate-binding protein, partial [Amphiplicatus sp.]